MAAAAPPAATAPPHAVVPPRHRPPSPRHRRPRTRRRASSRRTTLRSGRPTRQAAAAPPRRSRLVQGVDDEWADGRGCGGATTARWSLRRALRQLVPLRLCRFNKITEGRVALQDCKNKPKKKKRKWRSRRRRLYLKKEPGPFRTSARTGSSSRRRRAGQAPQVRRRSSSE